MGPRFVIFATAITLGIAAPVQTARARMCEVTRPDGTKVYTDKCSATSAATPVDGWCRSFMGFDAKTRLSVARKGMEGQGYYTMPDECVVKYLEPQLELGCRLGHPMEVVQIGAVASAAELCRRDGHPDYVPENHH